MLAEPGSGTLDGAQNIASHLQAMALKQPHTLAVVVPEGRSPSGRVRYCHLTYRQLDRESDDIAAGIAAAGIAKGMRAAVMVPPGLDFFALTFALFKAGVVPILIDPGMGLKSLAKCLREAAPEVFIGSRKAIWAKRMLGWGRESVQKVVLVAPKMPWTGLPTLDELRRMGTRSRAERPDTGSTPAPPGAEEIAAILFTSGSTGPPKGAVYTHAIFQAQIERFRVLYEIEPGEIDLCTFPLFALFAPALGMTSIVPDMDPTRPARVNPRNLYEAVEDFGPTNLFGSPALLRRVGPALSRRGLTLSSLRRVVTAGAPAPARVLADFGELLEPTAEVFTPYGATEALPVASIGSREILADTRQRTERGEGVCVGRPVEGIDLRFIRIDDDPIPAWSDNLEVPDGTVGEIAVSGPVVTREYFRRPDATALAKIPDLVRGTFYHRMGDLGYRDDQGRVWFCGRKSHRVRLEKATLFTICCEGVFNAHPDVARTALVGAEREGVTLPVICVELMRPLPQAERDRVRRELLELGSAVPCTKGITTFLFHPSFPVDIRHNSKIFREKLAAWAARRVR